MYSERLSQTTIVYGGQWGMGVATRNGNLGYSNRMSMLIMMCKNLFFYFSEKRDASPHFYSLTNCWCNKFISYSFYGLNSRFADLTADFSDVYIYGSYHHIDVTPPDFFQ